MAPVSRRTIALIVILPLAVSLVLTGCRRRSPEPTATPAPETVAVRTATPQAAPTSPLATDISPLSAPDSPLPTPSAMDSTSGAVVGRLVDIPTSWGRAVVFLAPFTTLEEGKEGGFYVLEPSLHPSAVVAADGSFILESVPPGDYVFMAGPDPETAVAGVDSEDPLIVEVRGGDLLSLGNVPALQ